MSTPYCKTCSDSKTNPCKKCTWDPHVMILHTDAKRLYKLTDYDITKLCYEYNFTAHRQTCSKYFLSEIEDVVINRLGKLNDTKSHEMLKKVIAMKNKRILYLARYTTIKTELDNLIKRLYEGLEFEFNDEVCAKIKECAELSDSFDENTCVNNIYYFFNDKITHAYWIRKRQTPVKNMLLDALGSGWLRLIGNAKYDYFCDVNRCGEDCMVDEINMEIARQKNIILRPKMLNELLEKQFGINLGENQVIFTQIINTCEYKLLANVDKYSWDDVVCYVQNNAKIFQRIIDRVKRQELVMHYVNTSVMKTYQKYVLDHDIVNNYINKPDSNKTFDQVKLLIVDLVERRKRELSVSRYVDQFIKTINIDADEVRYSLKNNAVVNNFITAGDVKINQIKGTIHNEIYKLVKHKMVVNYVKEQGVSYYLDAIQRSQIVIDFIGEDCDETVDLTDGVKEVIASYRNKNNEFIGNINSEQCRRQNVRRILSTKSDEWYRHNQCKVYSSQKVRNFLNNYNPLDAGCTWNDVRKYVLSM